MCDSLAAVRNRTEIALYGLITTQPGGLSGPIASWISRALLPTFKVPGGSFFQKVIYSKKVIYRCLEPGKNGMDWGGPVHFHYSCQNARAAREFVLNKAFDVIE